MTEITSTEISKYIEMRLNDDMSNASVNRELSILKRILTLANQRNPPLIEHVPKISKLKERNVRKGFFEHDEFIKFRKFLPEYVQGLATFGYKTGWRFGEIISLTWSQVDKVNWCVRLHAGETKNDESRIIYLDEELIDVFKKQLKLMKDAALITSYVFPSREGGKINNFKRSWNTAIKKSGIPRRIFHDLRRTAVRNMIRAGVPEVVAMRISGHKTRSVFDRYNIVNETDLKIAADKQENYLLSSLGTNSGTMIIIEAKRKYLTP